MTYQTPTLSLCTSDTSAHQINVLIGVAGAFAAFWPTTYVVAVPVQRPLDAISQEAIFSDLEGLYEE